MNRVFQEQLDAYVATIEAALPSFLPADRVPGSVGAAMEYSLCGGGKRIRGVLALAVYQMLGGSTVNANAALPAAAAVEMIHAYSLIHDDLPCMDDDNLRRGKPSCHIAFGETTALLAGDALLNRAFEVLSAPATEKVFGAERTLHAIRVLSGDSGIDGMIGGQEMDLANENTAASGERLEATDRKKTGALISSAACMAAVLAGAGDNQLEAVREYAGKIGLAFQIVDDILDETADQSLLGKPVGSDREQSKSTYTSVYGLEKAKEMAVRLSEEAKAALSRLDGDQEFLIRLADMLTQRQY
ncbi:MAG: polyprenyl synthetase family protein [Oscillospiraceae bacterium]